MHYSQREDVQILLENRYLLYLLFCSGSFELEKSINMDRHFSYSPIGYRTYEYHYSYWDHWAVIRCDSLAAEKLLLLRNSYHFPDEEQIDKELNSCKDWPDSDVAVYGPESEESV